MPVNSRVLGEIIEHVRRGGNLGRLTLLAHGAWRRLISDARVEGQKPSQPEHFGALSALLRVKVMRDDLRSRWDRYFGPIGGPSSAELGGQPKRSAGTATLILRGCSHGTRTSGCRRSQR